MNNDCIIITGAGKGIGRAIATTFATVASNEEEVKPHLVLISRTRSDLASVAAECETLGTTCDTFVADIGNSNDTRQIIDTTIARHGRINALINNAGIGIFKDFCTFTTEDYERTMETNVRGTFFLTQQVFAIMQQQRSGHIFFITSVAAETVFSTSALYSMSKFAQKGFIEALRLHARSCNVRVTNVVPGAVITPMWPDLAETTRSLMLQPEDIAIPLVTTYRMPERATIEELRIRPIAGDLKD